MLLAALASAGPGACADADPADNHDRRALDDGGAPTFYRCHSVQRPCEHGRLPGAADGDTPHVQQRETAVAAPAIPLSRAAAGRRAGCRRRTMLLRARQRYSGRASTWSVACHPPRAAAALPAVVAGRVWPLCASI